MTKIEMKELTDHDKMHLLSRVIMSGTFHFRTLQEGQTLAHFLALCFPNPNLAAFGILEIFINAVEHGNLGIHYEEKTKLQQTGKWLEEVERRLNLPENINKYVEVTFKKTEMDIQLAVKDAGEGFDWKKFQDIEDNRKLDIHGRGIAIAKSLVFQSLQYSEKGNEVTCIAHLSNTPSSPSP